ncbi:FAD-dependent oxidoreductase [Archangium lipolyticum]|uniref:FAD-dependent oxidoreductase n=1 Tax=Archangium lipolyticum TaxID=2970465 RepID=UPI002149C049|nr:lycopene cyclase [Archangium lipolyticum]
MLELEEIKARVREAGGPELLERLERLDAERVRPPVEARFVRAPGRGTRPDFDVVLVGGGLSLLFAPVLASLGLKVGVFERARAAVAHREWNISRPELAPLTASGLFRPEEVESLIVARYERGVCRWHGGGEYPVQGVLDHAVDAGRLLSEIRRRAERRGVAFHDGHSLVGMGEGSEAVRLLFERTGGGRAEVTARVVLDARGISSPHATADLLCPTVGGVLAGLKEGTAPDELDPRVGDILVTTEGVEEGRQHIWEGFPGRPGEATVYLFYYARARKIRQHALLQLYGRFFERLGGYKRGAPRLLRPTFGYIPGWSRLVPPPSAPGRRVVLVGDAAARHSPLTYCGFGAMMRSFLPGSRAIAAALASDRFPLGSIVHDTPLHSVTGALALFMAVPPREPERRDEVNRLLDTAFAALHEMGNDVYASLLKDQMPGPDFVRFLQHIAWKRPRVYRDALTLAGFGPLAVVRWLEGLSRVLLLRPLPP